MGVRVSFLEAKDASKPLSGYWIPNGALIKDGEQQFVFTVVDGKAKRVAITVADSNDSETRVSKGLGKGDSVIASPGKDLKEGARVANKADAAK